ncbi:MAG: T9SS type A sorting domain-containing protein [Saprospiraceae bacterium]|uniref:T9SS type A sorting domain-containing protein n=1 Tax=Candidatus Opimibacter skivensis TaxID=2982028 RepID=A0A9D7XTV3_9BACT|nr:T9SS type A sorting domain-containing protein [Candidatus Opimibacter skivensis]
MGCFGDFENGPIDYSYVIDSIGSMDINGILLRTQFVTVVDPPGLQPSWYFRGPIIERIGQIGYGGYWWGSGEACILEDNGFLRCYFDPDVTYSDPYFSAHHECDYTGTDEIEPYQEAFIFPNPTTDFISLPANASEINLFNSTGQKIESYKNQDQIDVSNLLPGIYIIQYQINSKNYIRKFLKL